MIYFAKSSFKNTVALAECRDAALEKCVKKIKFSISLLEKNIILMEEKQTIVACGAGSVSKRVYPSGRIERCENVKDVALYIEKIDEMIERKWRLLADY